MIQPYLYQLLCTINGWNIRSDYIIDVCSREPEVPKELDRSIQNLQQLYFDFIYGSDSTNATQGNSGKRGLVIRSRAVHVFVRNLSRKEGRIQLNVLKGRIQFNLLGNFPKFACAGQLKLVNPACDYDSWGGL